MYSSEYAFFASATEQGVCQQSRQGHFHRSSYSFSLLDGEFCVNSWSQGLVQPSSRQLGESVDSKSLLIHCIIWHASISQEEISALK